MNFDNLGAPTPAPAGVLNLSKGGVLDLTKVAPALTRVLIGCGWDVAKNGPTADLDASSILVPRNAPITAANINQHIVFYNNLEVQGVKSLGDNRTGAGEGDDEQILVDLNQVDLNIDKIVFTVTIFDAQAKRQSFGMIEEAYIRIVNQETDEEICRYQLNRDYATDTAIEFGALKRTDHGWAFEAIGKGFIGDLNTILAQYM